VGQNRPSLPLIDNGKAESDLEKPEKEKKKLPKGRPTRGKTYQHTGNRGEISVG